MASTSSLLLAMAALAAFFAVGSCDNIVKFTVGKGTTPTYSHLVLIANLPVHEVAIRELYAPYFHDDMTESPGKTFTMDFKTPLRGPLSIRVAVAPNSYRNKDDFIPIGLKPGAVIDTTIKMQG